MRKPGKVVNGVYMVGGQDLTDMRDCCVYLVDGGSELALIDAGLGYSCRTIVDNITELGFDPALLKYVITTHGHIDHTGGLYYFQSRGAQIVAHECELDAIEKGIPQLTAAAYYKVQYKPVTVDVVLHGQQQEIKVGSQICHCLFTPGHTPGGISPYLDRDDTRVLFGQDIHGPFNPAWGSDMDQWLKSMDKLLQLQADVLCEGHFGVYRPAAKVRNYIEHYRDQYA